ncbi:hypothetical protein BV898_14840 [Hypsibius exemplaris]|uniref:Neurotransmitter-gated ion-channel transmembrane domain-containing protein n=1 Tax=Hypsibius exemplaris TaxID=2072580 RepID=A0A9X6NA87_HYPEX|nr:hypothetical protein BV898_14840 [Hypsibius exemplaris]
MSPWVRKLFLTHLPKLLMIERPSSVEDLHSINGASQYTTTSRRVIATHRSLPSPGGRRVASPRSQKKLGLSPEVRSAVRGVNFIVEHAREANNFKTVSRTRAPGRGFFCEVSLLISIIPPPLVTPTSTDEQLSWYFHRPSKPR